MCYMKRVMAMVLALAMILSASLVAFAAESPVVGPTYEDEANTRDHKDKAVDTTVKNGTAAIVKSVRGEEDGNEVVDFRIARDANKKQVAVTQIGTGKAGVFDSDEGRYVTMARVLTKADVTIAKYAFKGSKVHTIGLEGQKKVTIKKNAFLGTKVKTVTIKVRGSRRKASFFKFEKGAFNGLSSKSKVIVSKKTMTKAEFNKLKKALKKAGFKGTITRK